jgi:hypothetical protein
MTGAGVLPAMLFGASVLGLVPAGEIELTDRSVRIGDVVRRGDLDAALAERTIATLPPGRDSVTIERSALAGLLRRAVPGFRVESADEGTVALRAAAAERADRRCLELINPVAAGAIIDAEDVVAIECRDGEGAVGIAYDRIAAAPRAAADLAAGHYLGRVVLGPAGGADAGAALTLASTIGPVRIERRVVALQPARQGGRLFVRTEDGEVLVAAIAAERDE